MKLRDSQATLSVTSYGLAQQLIGFYGDIKGNVPYLGEVVLSAVAHSRLPEDITDVPITNVLDFLNNKIESARKTISFWDAYQIREAITDRDQFLGQLANMPANSSIASSLREPFEWTDQNNESHMIYRGDIIIKDYLEQLHYIPSLNTGFYIPKAGSLSGNTFNITYEYATKEPATPPQVSITGFSSSQWGGYNKFITVAAGHSDNSISVISNIKPIVKSFVQVGSGYEQVFLDTTFQITDNKIVLINNTTTTLFFEVK